MPQTYTHNPAERDAFRSAFAGLEGALRDVAFPQSKEGLRAIVQANRVEMTLQELVEQLPDQTYWNVPEVIEQLTHHAEVPGKTRR